MKYRYYHVGRGRTHKMTLKKPTFEDCNIKWNWENYK